MLPDKEGMHTTKQGVNRLVGMILDIAIVIFKSYRGDKLLSIIMDVTLITSLHKLLKAASLITKFKLFRFISLLRYFITINCPLIISL